MKLIVFLVASSFFLITQPMRTVITARKIQKLVPDRPPLSPRDSNDAEDFIVCESDTETNNRPRNLQTILCEHFDCQYTTKCAYHMKVHQLIAHSKK